MQAVLVAVELAVDLYLVASDVHDLDVGDDVLEAGNGLLWPVDTRVELPDAALKDVFAFVEPVDLGVCAGELALPVAELDVAAHGHPVVELRCEQVEPLFETSFVEETSFAVQEFLELLLEDQPLYRCCSRADIYHLIAPRPYGWTRR